MAQQFAVAGTTVGDTCMRIRYATSMPRFESLAYRDCPWCGVKLVAMHLLWSRAGIYSSDQDWRSWAAYACPRCAGVTTIEMQKVKAKDAGAPPEGKISSEEEVEELQSLPGPEHQRYEVEHLPDDVAAFLFDAIRVLDSGVPDAAAVQLRRTLEASAAHHNVRERNLVASIRELIGRGLITRDFGEVLNHVRKIGNIGAHYTDERITRIEAERALRFTIQVLRNLFEVPGELELLRVSSTSDDRDAGRVNPEEQTESNGSGEESDGTDLDSQG